MRRWFRLMEMRLLPRHRREGMWSPRGGLNFQRGDLYQSYPWSEPWVCVWIDWTGLHFERRLP